MIVDKYYGYGLTKTWKNMTWREKETILACYWMVDRKQTIRATAYRYIYSPTTFWRRIHFTCSDLSPSLYKDVKKQLKENLKKRGNYAKKKK